MDAPDDESLTFSAMRLQSNHLNNIILFWAFQEDLVYARLGVSKIPQKDSFNFDI
jgi:hypothetical protein